ncbi:YdhK family protein, partial [Micrococcus sp. SIMBA_144]
EEMEHSGSSEVPEGLKRAENPTYPKSSKAIIETDHMKGMKGAEATISGAFETTSYVVSYMPTNGGELVENHKWVIHEELDQPDNAPLT